MSDAPARLLTKLEIEAIRGRVNVWPDSVLPLAKVIFAEDDWGEKETEMLRFAPLDIPALLAHIDVLESLISDMAGDEGVGAVLRMRRGLEEVEAKARACSALGKPTSLRSALMDVACAAREALK